MECYRCKSHLPVSAINADSFLSCTGCGAKYRVDLFPAALNPKGNNEKIEHLIDNMESSCFYHSKNKAIAHCDICGRFLCSLCNAGKPDGNPLCFQCLHNGLTKSNWTHLVTKRIIYEDIALSVAFFPLFFFWITFITAPIALFITIRYFKRPSSITRKLKYRYIFAGILSSIQIGGWLMFIFSLIPKR